MAQLHDRWSLLGSDSRYFILTGGRSSGKSYALSYFIVSLISIESGHRIMLSRATMTAARDSVIVEVKQRIEELGIEDQFDITEREITHRETGSSVFFKGLKSSSGQYTAALKSLAKVTTFILDEAEELRDEAIFDKIDLSIRTKTRQNRVILALNPETREHFIYDRFFLRHPWEEGNSGKNGDVTYIHSIWTDVQEHMSESVIKRFRQIEQEDPDYYNNVIKGGWRERREGVIITNHRQAKSEDAWESISKGLPTLYGLDFGFTDPTSLVEGRIDEYNRKLYAKVHVYETGLIEDEVFEKVWDICGPIGEIIGDSARPDNIESFQRKGMNIWPAKKGAGSIEKGLDILRNFEIIVCPSGPELSRELNNYTWKKNPDGKHIDKPMDEWNHAIDSLRYLVFYHLEDTYSTELDIL